MSCFEFSCSLELYTDFKNGFKSFLKNMVVIMFWIPMPHLSIPKLPKGLHHPSLLPSCPVRDTKPASCRAKIFFSQKRDSRCKIICYIIQKKTFPHACTEIATFLLKKHGKKITFLGQTRKMSELSIIPAYGGTIAWFALAPRFFRNFLHHQVLQSNGSKGQFVAKT